MAQKKVASLTNLLLCTLYFVLGFIVFVSKNFSGATASVSQSSSAHLRE